MEGFSSGRGGGGGGKEERRRRQARTGVVVVIFLYLAVLSCIISIRQQIYISAGPQSVCFTSRDYFAIKKCSATYYGCVPIEISKQNKMEM